MKLLVTGSSGFIGSRVVEMGRDKDWDVVSVVRGEVSENSLTCLYPVSSISSNTDWSGAFEGVDCVVHCAARVHQMKECELDACAAYKDVNTLGTLNLARQAAESGVKRFIFLSSIKVNGEFSLQSMPFESNLEYIPQDPYGRSKYEAELGLHRIAKETGLEVVVIRPPLVYGPGVKANFRSLMKCIRRGLPLPLGAIYNQRSLVYRDNLVDLILCCCVARHAAGETFLVSDDEDVSTTELIYVLAKAMERGNRLIPIPMKWIRFVAGLLGETNFSDRICGNLQVDISHTKKVLDWTPPVSFEEGIKRTVRAYLEAE